MNVKNFFPLGIIFIISFFISSFLGLISGISFSTFLMRALFSSLIMVLIAAAFWFILKTYFPEIYSIFSKNFKGEDEKQEEMEIKENQDSSSSFIHKEELNKSSLEDSSKIEKEKDSKGQEEDQVSFSKIWDENKDKVKEPTFSDLEKEIGWNHSSSDDPEGLKKVTKERFSSQDPQVMAQTIRNILVDDKKL